MMISMRSFLAFSVLLATLAAGCGSKPKPLPPAQRFNKLESRIERMREDIAKKQQPDFDDLDRVASQYASSLRGTPKEEQAKKLADKIRELGKSRLPYDKLKEGVDEIEKIYATLQEPAP